MLLGKDAAIVSYSSTLPSLAAIVCLLAFVLFCFVSPVKLKIHVREGGRREERERKNTDYFKGKPSINKTKIFFCLLQQRNMQSRSPAPLWKLC